MAELRIIEKYLNIMFRTIKNKNLAPTVVARFQYLVSTIIYYSIINYKNAKNVILNEPNLPLVYNFSKKIIRLEKFISEGMKYLYNQYDYPTNEIPNIFIKKQNKNIQKAIDTLNNFLNSRKIDGYTTAFTQPPSTEAKNINLFIDVEDGLGQTLDGYLYDNKQWTPLRHIINGAPVIQKYATPGWGNLTPVNGTDISKYENIGNDNYDETQRINEIAEILKVYENLNDQQKMIAEYFQGGSITPPGIWNIWALYTIKSVGSNPVRAAEFLYQLNSAMFTASIAAWKLKRTKLQARPIQEIRLLTDEQVFNILGKYTVTNYDGAQVSSKQWKPFQQSYFMTPPFPDYISGHSTFSSSAAIIFERYFPQSFSSINFLPFNNEHGSMITDLLEGNTYINTVKSISIKINSSTITSENNDYPTCSCKLTFNGWRDLANNSGISRVYGGIHGNNANNTGLIIGETIGFDILNRPRFYPSGTKNFIKKKTITRKYYEIQKNISSIKKIYINN